MSSEVLRLETIYIRLLRQNNKKPRRDGTHLSSQHLAQKFIVVLGQPRLHETLSPNKQNTTQKARYSLPTFHSFIQIIKWNVLESKGLEVSQWTKGEAAISIHPLKLFLTLSTSV